jgi:hypothetical protein
MTLSEESDHLTVNMTCGMTGVADYLQIIVARETADIAVVVEDKNFEVMERPPFGALPLQWRTTCVRTGN